MTAGPGRPHPKGASEFDLTAMVMADNATNDHLSSARPDAPLRPSRPPRQRGDAIRRLTVTALRTLADRVETKRLEVAS